MSAQTKEFINIFLSNYSEEVQMQIEKYRRLILKKFQKIQEQFDASARIIGYGFGQKYTDLICTIIPSKKGIKLGFYKGSELSDPKRIMTGTGKVHRYVDIKTADIKDVEALLDNAYANYLERKK